MLGGQTLLEHAARAALDCPEVTHLVVVAPSSHLDDAAHALRPLDHADRVDIVAGGDERTASVAAGLRALRHEDGIVLVHDAARALAPSELFGSVIHAVRSGHPAVVPGVPVVDTIKQVDGSGRVTATLDRSRLRAVQTPQGFLREVLEHAHAHDGGPATDDAGLVERAGGHVRVIEGDVRAHKITTPADLVVAEQLLEC